MDHVDDGLRAEGRQRLGQVAQTRRPAAALHVADEVDFLGRRGAALEDIGPEADGGEEVGAEARRRKIFEELLRLIEVRRRGRAEEGRPVGHRHDLHRRGGGQPLDDGERCGAGAVEARHRAVGLGEGAQRDEIRVVRYPRRDDAGLRRHAHRRVEENNRIDRITAPARAAKRGSSQRQRQQE